MFQREFNHQSINLERVKTRSKRRYFEARSKLDYLLVSRDLTLSKLLKEHVANRSSLKLTNQSLKKKKVEFKSKIKELQLELRRMKLNYLKLKFAGRRRKKIEWEMLIVD